MFQAQIFSLTYNDGLSTVVHQIVTLSHYSAIHLFLHNTIKPSIHVYLFNTTAFDISQLDHSHGSSENSKNYSKQFAMKRSSQLKNYKLALHIVYNNNP